MSDLASEAAPALSGFGWRTMGGGLAEAPEKPSDTAAERGSRSFTSQSGLVVFYRDGVPILPGRLSLRAAFLKRASDIVMAALGLLVLLPLLLGVALAIKLTSRGPVLFAQERVGRDNRMFRLLKFRTMYAEQTDISGIAQTRAGDQRVTPLGALLRRTSIDELPQLLNVLLGDMSIIGPRPHVAGMLAAGIDYRELVPHYDLRHMVRPGISGWAQANGLRGPTADANAAIARIHHDFAYLANHSLGLDLRIVVLTLKREFLTGNGI